MSLTEALGRIDKMFGAGAVMRMSDAPQSVEVIPSGSLALDRALGIGGYPRGRIVELYGPESSGKSTLALHAAANAQRVGAVAYVDTEHALDPKYAADLGVSVDDLLMAQPDNAEQALEIMQALIDSGDVSMVILDSIAALVTRRELEGDFGDSNVGDKARLMNQAMRKLVGRAERTNTLVLCINQLRMKVGIVFGSPEVTPGGWAIKYASSIRLDIRRIATEKSGDDAVGNETRVKVVKNKLAPPLKQATFTIRYGEGICRELELVDLGLACGVVKKNGSWLSYAPKSGDPIRLAQGRENARQKLAESRETASEIEALVMEKMT